MKINFKNINERWKEYALGGSVCVVVLVVLLNLGKIFRGIGSVLAMFSPIFIGLIVAYIMNPPAMFLARTLFGKIKKEKLRWLLSVLLSFVLVLGILALIMAMLIPQVASNLSKLLEYFRPEGVSDVIEGGIHLSFLPDSLNESLNNMLFGEEGIVSRLGGFLANNLSAVISATSTAGSKAAAWLVGLILSIYFLIAKSGILAACRKLLGLILTPFKYARWQILLDKFNSIFSKYIVCEILDALFVGVINFLFMLIAGLPNALFISVIAAVTNLAPTFGPVIGLVISCFFLLLSAPKKVLLYIIFTLLLQLVDGYFIKPKLFGGALNVPGVLILVFIIIFGKIMGISGMLIAIPVAGIAMYLYNEALIPWLQFRHELKDFKKEESRKAESENVQ